MKIICIVLSLLIFLVFLPYILNIVPCLSFIFYFIILLLLLFYLLCSDTCPKVLDVSQQLPHHAPVALQFLFFQMSLYSLFVFSFQSLNIFDHPFLYNLFRLHIFQPFSFSLLLIFTSLSYGLPSLNSISLFPIPSLLSSLLYSTLFHVWLLSC